VACKDWHDIPAGPANWRRVINIEKGKFPDVFVAYLSLSCCHCEAPACVEACPAGAITKRSEDGVVLVDPEACLGKDSCGVCLEACPYDVPQFREDGASKMEKCNFCIDRLSEGKPPICVAGCPMRALDAGPVDQLEAKYGANRGAEGFAHDPELRPGILFKPKHSKIS